MVPHNLRTLFKIFIKIKIKKPFIYTLFSYQSTWFSSQIMEFSRGPQQKIQRNNKGINPACSLRKNYYTILEWMSMFL